jgi:RHH-type proline utilization regulon transcriptional repressor/proline dehydrogenase/delta 1-pyrroline-5-carboxylate dehydrogenase
MEELYPVLRDLALLACRYDIGLNIDAEESDRLEISLDLLERLCFEPELAGFAGIGFVVQAYQKRCPFVIDHVIDLARRSGHRLMVRLVKGAYWDSEIKRAQIDGLEGYPVYTRKPYTDLAYVACARKLLAAPEAVYPQFATHNAQTLAAIHEIADPQRWTPGQYEFQCLHGMGEPLYEQVVGARGLDRPCRIYAPVGTHETLLAYLVRRLLENGANTSFVNRIADRTLSLERLVQDPVALVEQMAVVDGAIGSPHPSIPLPRALYGSARSNSAGLDLASESQLDSLDAALTDSLQEDWRAAPMTPHDDSQSVGAPVRNPADRRDLVGHVVEASLDDVKSALYAAEAAAAGWASTPVARRAQLLERAADALQADMPRLMGLILREAGKTASSAIAEVREAVDYLRYYAAQAREHFDDAQHLPLGPVVCISPWNFPLAIFTGQIGAALAAGNVVLAKPAEQTPLIAAEMVRVLRRAGIPEAALQLLPGRGEIVGAALIADARVQGVMFTGSTDVARRLQATLAKRLDRHGKPVTLIAETGGQNAMIVDSSALAEQVVQDVLSSAFDSAGQRCSALRVLCVQDDAADRIVEMLEGAMGELDIGSPDALDVDVGPVIDEDARGGLERHIAAMRASGHRVVQPALRGDDAIDAGSFVKPTLIELEHLGELEREVFGPVLHLVRYRRVDLDSLIDQINATGYGLTLGLHTRIDETIARVVDRAHAGNLYVNRNMVGAVVGVQPFGGEGLSGTGPKAGGPLYLHRLLAARPDGSIAAAMSDDEAAVDRPADRTAIDSLKEWAQVLADAPLAKACDWFAAASPAGASVTLKGPTGERNLYTLVPREAVLCLADDDQDRLIQLAAVLAVGSRAVWPAEASMLFDRLPAELHSSIALMQDWTRPAMAFDAVLHHGDAASLQSVVQRIAKRDGPIVGVSGYRSGDTAIALERLVIERALSINTAAAGGNASLMSIG